jgi:hypothetical protein
MLFAWLSIINQNFQKLQIVIVVSLPPYLQKKFFYDTAIEAAVSSQVP